MLLCQELRVPESNATATAWGDSCLTSWCLLGTTAKSASRGAQPLRQGGGCTMSTPRPGWTTALHDVCPHMKDIFTLALTTSEAGTGRAC